MPSKQFSELSLLLAVFFYGATAVSLWIYTGDPHIGMSYPLANGLAGLLVGLLVDWRVDYGDERAVAPNSVIELLVLLAVMVIIILLIGLFV